MTKPTTPRWGREECLAYARHRRMHLEALGFHVHIGHPILSKGEEPDRQYETVWNGSAWRDREGEA